MKVNFNILMTSNIRLAIQSPDASPIKNVRRLIKIKLCEQKHSETIISIDSFDIAIFISRVYCKINEKPERCHAIIDIE